MKYLLLIAILVAFTAVQYLIDKYKWEKKNKHFDDIIKTVCNIQNKTIQYPIVVIDINHEKGKLPENFFAMRKVSLLNGKELSNNEFLTRDGILHLSELIIVSRVLIEYVPMYASEKF